jgi:putative hemolysin
VGVLKPDQQGPAVAPRMGVGLATSAAEVRESQALRYRIFALEQGAELATPVAGLDIDRYDERCRHLLVRDLASGEVVASTRLLAEEDAESLGGFYSESEFDLAPILGTCGRLLEVGRTCVAPGWRNGATISVLWSGLAEVVAAGGFESLIGCASMELTPATRGLVTELQQRFGVPEPLRVRPRRPLPEAPLDSPSEGDGNRLPPLLKAYFRLGARVCGDACWDPDFHVADLLVHLELDQLAQRYGRHYLGRSRGERAATAGRAADPGLAAAAEAGSR